MLKHFTKTHCTNYPHFQVAKGQYVGPLIQPGSLVANKCMDLMCIDVISIDPSQNSNENMSVLPDTFSKSSQAFIIPNQKAPTIIKLLVDKWFYTYGISF